MDCAELKTWDAWSSMGLHYSTWELSFAAELEVLLWMELGEHLREDVDCRIFVGDAGTECGGAPGLHGEQSCGAMHAM